MTTNHDWKLSPCGTFAEKTMKETYSPTGTLTTIVDFATRKVTLRFGNTYIGCSNSDDRFCMYKDAEAFRDNLIRTVNKLILE